MNIFTLICVWKNLLNPTVTWLRDKMKEHWPGFVWNFSRQGMFYKGCGNEAMTSWWSKSGQTLSTFVLVFPQHFRTVKTFFTMTIDNIYLYWWCKIDVCRYQNHSFRSGFFFYHLLHIPQLYCILFVVFRRFFFAYYISEKYLEKCIMISLQIEI